jgi:hypothetical protein
MTAVMAEKMKNDGRLYGLSSLSSLILYIVHAVYRAFCSCAAYESIKKGILLYTHMVFFSDDSEILMTDPLTRCFQTTICCHHSLF